MALAYGGEAVHISAAFGADGGFEAPHGYRRRIEPVLSQARDPRVAGHGPAFAGNARRPGYLPVSGPGAEWYLILLEVKCCPPPHRTFRIELFFDLPSARKIRPTKGTEQGGPEGLLWGSNQRQSVNSPSRSRDRSWSQALRLFQPHTYTCRYGCANLESECSMGLVRDLPQCLRCLPGTPG